AVSTFAMPRQKAAKIAAHPGSFSEARFVEEEHIRKYEQRRRHRKQVQLPAAPSKRMRLALEEDVFAEHLNEAKGDVRLYRGESRFDAGAELSPERLLLGGRFRVGQQCLDEDEVGGRPPKRWGWRLGGR